MLSENHDYFPFSTSSKVYFRQALGSDDIKQDSGPTCKFYNGAGFGKCVQLNCRFLHLCCRCRGLREGFDTGISNIPNKPLEWPNLRSARRNPENVTRLVAEELNKGFLIGPYNSPPFINYRINPIGLVESKYSKKKRLIVDLSAPHNDKDHPSINSLIYIDSYCLSYVTVDDAIKSIQQLGKGA
ncbi:unnamed protein product [Rotaria sp. Silwood1]|nr:unnamed protein product [Rotaria sp. Silwood1]CAF1436759.1 unnamed protein product [Rotaria sp. Silwood1]